MVSLVSSINIATVKVYIKRMQTRSKIIKKEQLHVRNDYTYKSKEIRSSIHKYIINALFILLAYSSMMTLQLFLL